MPTEPSGTFDVLVRGLSWGIQTVVIRVTDTAGAVVEASFVVEVPVDGWVWALVGAGVVAAVPLAALVVVR